MLDPAYLEYSRRRRGPDHDLFEWSCLFDRPPVRWPGSARVAIPIVVDLEYFPLTATDRPFRAPSHMQTPFPDLRNFTARDYGTRVGIYRLLDLFRDLDITVSVAVNSVLAQRARPVIDDILADGHEIIAHSIDMNGTVATGLPEADERALIEQSIATLEQATGTRPRGWLSIAQSQSWNTPRLLVEAGVEYMCDWVNDDLPYAMTTAAGGIINLPLNHELSDRRIILMQQHGIDSYAEQIADAYDWLTDEAQATGSGRMLPLNLTPYIIALPHRIGGLRTLLTRLRASPDAWFVPAGAIVDTWRAATSG